MIGHDTLPRLRRIAGRYVIESTLGRGRSSVVYKALDTETGTHVALKILDPLLAQDPVAAERFSREAQILRALNHPNIIKVYALFRDGDWSVICMECFEGLDGKTYVERYGRLPIADFLRVAKTLASALEACHRLKVVHRDLKPHNILINDDRDVKIVDFGISKMNTMSDLTRTGSVFGTPQYLAPEMFRSSRADPRSDIYALGATCYELLAGRPPFPATSLGAVMTQQLRGEIEPFSSFRDDVPRWLAAVVFKCLRTDPAQRYQSGYELLRDIERGELAYVTYESNATPVSCVACQAPLLSGLPFCHQCGTFRALVVERGPKCVTLTRCDAIDPLRSFLAAQFPHVPPRRLSAALARRPAVLFQGVSARTAAGLMHQLSFLPCELQITDHLATAMKVPGAYALVGIALVLPLFWMADKISALTRALLIVGAELAVIGLYWRRAQPTIPVPSLRRRGDAIQTAPSLATMADRLRRVGNGNLRMILAQIVRSYVGIGQRLQRSNSPLRLDVIEKAILTAIETAPVIERHELYLSGTSLNELEGRRLTVDAELQRTNSPGECEALIPLKTKLSRDVQHYRVIQDAHASMYLDLLKLQAVLHRMEDALQDTRTGAAILAELRGIEHDLRAAVAMEEDEAHGQ
ncbi:MAG: serine/threonine protein kinase [Candidatus Binatia bacterium]